jgi:hypothetical protein
LELNLKEITASIVKLQQTCRKVFLNFRKAKTKDILEYLQTMPESARRQREREIKFELLQNADMYNLSLHFFSIFLFLD